MSTALWEVVEQRPTFPQAVIVNVFLDGLYKKVTPSFCSIGDEISKGCESLRPYWCLKQSLPDKFHRLEEEAEQVKNTTGEGAARILEETGLREDDRKKVREMLEQIKAQLFDTDLDKLLKHVEECEKKFTEHQGGFDQCMSQQEAKLRDMHAKAKLFQLLYMPASILNERVHRDLVIGGLVGFLPLLFLHFSKRHRVIKNLVAAGGYFALYRVGVAKYYHFGECTDFQTLQGEIEDILNQVRCFKRKGSEVSTVCEQLKEDIATIKSHKTVFEQLIQQIPFLQGRSQDVDTWDSKMLSEELRKLELPECADKLMKAGISGHAFLTTLTEQDFEHMGITDLTLRRLMDIQANMKKPQAKEMLCSDAKTAAEELKKAMQQVVGCIVKMREKYSYNPSWQ